MAEAVPELVENCVAAAEDGHRTDDIGQGQVGDLVLQTSTVCASTGEAASLPNAEVASVKRPDQEASTPCPPSRAFGYDA